jgi:hypothetical protein
VAHLPTAVSLLLQEALFMQTSGVSLALTWPRRLCLLRVLLGTITTATSFPLSNHTGWGDTAHAFSGLRVYLQFTWEVVLPFLSCAVFLLLPLSQAFLLLIAGCVLPLLPSPASLLWGISPSPSSVLRAPRPLCYVSFLLLLLIIQFFFLFSLGGGRSVQGTMLIWHRIVCGSTECRLAHLMVSVFPSCLGTAIWQQHGSPPGFSI